MSVAEIQQNVLNAIAQSMSGNLPTQPVANATASEDESISEANALILNDWDDSGTTFDFEEEFQAKIAALTVRDPDFIRRTRDCVEPGYFDNVGNSLIVNLAQTYYDRYARLPNNLTVWVQLIKDAIASKQLREQFKETVVEALRAAFKADLSDVEYCVDKISEFSKHQEILRALNESIQLVSKGQFDQIEKRMKKAFLKGAAGNYRELDYWESVNQRTQARKDRLSGLIKPTGIPLGIPAIDNMLFHKGFGRRELTVLMGAAKKGKSMGLGEFALRFSKQGYNVLYATLEVANEIIAARMDANITRTELKNLDDNAHSVEDKVITERNKGVGKLFVLEFPTGSLTPNMLRARIEHYKAQGVKFDVIITDYADIMAPNIRTNDPIENSKDVWVGLRAIGQEEDAAMVTATQTNRDGFKSDTARAEHAAEDFNKIRIADLVMSINRTDEERARGEARLFFAASRNQEGEMTVVIKQTLASMNFIDKIVQMSH